jgi:hypothetical protein
MAYTWEDTPITADTTKAREKHRRDLCANVNLELARRGAAPYAWINTPGPAAEDVLKWGKVDIDQLYAACTAAKAACSYDGTALPVWPTVTQDQTLVRAIHITQLRIYIDDLNNIACPTHCPTPCGPCAYSCPCQSHCDTHCGMH